VAPVPGVATLLPAPVTGLAGPEAVVGGQGGPPQEIVLGAVLPSSGGQQMVFRVASPAETPEQTLAKGDELKTEPGLDFPPGQSESSVVTFDLT